MVQPCHRKHFLFQTAMQADVKQRRTELVLFKAEDLQWHPRGFKRAGQETLWSIYHSFPQALSTEAGELWRTRCCDSILNT